MHPLSTIADAHAETLLLPDTDAELREVVRQLHSDGQAWIPAGLATRLDWSAPLQNAGPSLSVQHLKGVIDHAVDDLTITVQAGLPLMELQRLLAEQQQWLPVDWPWGSCSQIPTSAGTVGGLVARGLSGSLRQRHMGVRDQLIGIGLLRSDGVAAHAGGRVVKNVAGYDLMRLLCGSWGSLALITEVTLRVQPLRRHRRALLIRGAARQLEPLRATVVGSGFTPDWIDWERTGTGDCSLQLGVASISDAAVQDQLGPIARLAAEAGLETSPQTWVEAIPEPISIDQPTPWLLRLCLPPARCAELLASEACQQLQGWHWRLAAGRGSGEVWQSGEAASSAAQVQALRQRVLELDGEMTVLKQPAHTPDNQQLPAWLDAPSKAVIAAVKHQFDPKHQLARGRLPGVATPLG